MGAVMDLMSLCTFCRGRSCLHSADVSSDCNFAQLLLCSPKSLELIAYLSCAAMLSWCAEKKKKNRGVRRRNIRTGLKYVTGGPGQREGRPTGFFSLGSFSTVPASAASAGAGGLGASRGGGGVTLEQSSTQTRANAAEC